MTCEQNFPNDAERAFALKNIRARLAHPENWTKAQEARDKAGYEVPVDSPNAYSFCLLGAAYFSGLPFSETTELLSSLISDDELPEWAFVGGTHPGAFYAVFQWNDADSRRHIQVLEKLDTGIKQFDPTYAPPRQTLWQRFKSWSNKGIPSRRKR